jgi:hypothetical protein
MGDYLDQRDQQVISVLLSPGQSVLASTSATA